MELEHASSALEGRKRSRFACNATVTVKTVDNRVVTGMLRDIGLHSLYVFTDTETDEFLIFGEKVEVTISMHSTGSTLNIEVAGNIARMDAFGFVIQFQNSLKWWPVFTMFPNKENH